MPTPVMHDTTALHQEIQHFYARHMQLLDSGAVDEWTEAFTEDGVFAANARPEPTRGREAIRVMMRRAKEERVRAGLQRRHWFGMLKTDQQDDGSVAAVFYTLVFATPRGGEPVLQLSALCEDELVRDGDVWRIRLRQVSRDDIGTLE